MPLPKDVYINCDILENIPKANKANWLKEIKLLQKKISQQARVLQVGSMDGTRAINLLKVRPDLKITGIEIEPALVEIARKNIITTEHQVDFIVGDITQPPPLPVFDYVICLNNTLGYISDQLKAIQAMKQLGKIIIISVYGEKFNNNLAQEYFKSIKLKIEKIVEDNFIMKDFTIIKRYTKTAVTAWGGEVIETPLGYFCIINT